MAANFDFTRFAVGGATRPDSFTGLSPQFQQSLAALLQAAPGNIQPHLKVMSGFRSPQRQTELWNQALTKYGSPAAARKWVAPPGRSQHNHGNAVDLRYLDPTARQWVHQNAAQYGLHFPMKHEPWHIEPIGARGHQHDHGPASSAAPMMAQAGASSPLANMVAGAAPGAPMQIAPEGEPQQPPGLGQLALLFAQQQVDRRRQREEEAAAEQTRRAALFSPEGLAGLYSS